MQALIDLEATAGGPTWTVLSSHTNRPKTELPVVRMLDAVHRIVLAGRAPELTPYYPSTGGDGDAVVAWPLFCEVVTRNTDELRLPSTSLPRRTRSGVARPLWGANEDDRLDLLSYAWPDETAHFELLRSALDLCARFPLVVEGAQIPEWLAANVSPLPPGMVTVVMNSYVWQYLDDQDAAAARAALESAAALATTEAPLAHLSFEALDADYANTQLRLTLPGHPGGSGAIPPVYPPMAQHRS